MDGYILNILDGSWLTLGVSVGSLLVACTLGLLGASCKLSSQKWLVVLADLYSTVIRGVPDLVLMLLIYYGGQIGANALAESLGMDEGIDINPLIAGILTLGFIYGAYLSETFRGALIAIPKGQSEAAMAYGMGRLRIFFRIVLPQMVRLAIPGFTNNWLVLIKASALVSLIGLQDMMFRAKQASGITHSAFLYFMVAAGVYLLITTVSLIALKWLDKRFSLGVRRGEL